MLSRRLPPIRLLLLVGLSLAFAPASRAAHLTTTVHLQAPGTLSQANTTYILDNDVSAAGTCFTINVSNVVLDLGGHTVTYNASAGDGAYGVIITWNQSNIRITDGLLSQGPGNGYQSYGVFGEQANSVEVDHLLISYQGDDNEGIYLNGGSFAQNADVHDNVIHPNGTKRAGTGGIITHFADFAGIGVNATAGAVTIANNDIEGKGYQGIHYGYSKPLSSTLEITGNTIKMAAPVRDGYGIVINSPNNDNVGFEIAHNTIVQSSGRGILVEGNVSDSSPGPGVGSIHDNLINVREAEDSGEYPNAPGASTGICVRFGAHDINVYNNSIVAWAGANAAPPQFSTQQGPACIARALKVHSGANGHDNNVYNNVINVATTDTTYPAAAIVAINAGAVPGVNELFHNNVATSNSYIVDLNCDDGSGSYQTFVSNIFIKGPNPVGFHSINSGYWTGQAIGNVFLDNTFAGGADAGDVHLSGSGGAPYSLTMQWYLNESVKDSTGNAVPGAIVQAIATGGGAETVSDTTDAQGRVQLVMTDYTRSGTTFPQTSNYSYFSPDSVITTAPGHPPKTRTVAASTSQELTVVIANTGAQPPVISHLVVSNLTQTTATVSWQTDHPASGRVEYGLDTTYGSVVTDTTMVSSHTLVLTGLTTTTYHFRIIATDAGGRQNQGADHFFVILPLVPGTAAPPAAAFTGSPASGVAPLSVSFQDQSTGGPTTWSWTFGDGDSSSVQNPGHVYQTPGTYTVSLTAGSTQGSNTLTRTGYIAVTAAPGAPVLVSPPNGASGQSKSLLLIWRRDPQVVYYGLEMAPDAGFAHPELNVSGLRDSSRAVGPLVPGSQHFWKVTATEPDSSKLTSGAFSFIVASIPAPVLMAPANGAQDIPVPTTFVWHRASSATTYQLEVAPDSVFVQSPDTVKNLADTTLTTSVLPYYAARYWRVRSGDGVAFGFWSDRRSLRTEPAATVYPGDANNDGQVDARDLLPLGLYFGLTGSARVNPSTQWSAQILPSPWAHPYENAAYADCDGDGRVDAGDIVGIVQNWQARPGQPASLAADQDAICREILQAIDANPLAPGMSSLRGALVEYMKKALGHDLAFHLGGNRPNPFHEETSWLLTTPQPAAAELAVFDPSGKRVWSTVLSNVPAGTTAITWDGSSLQGNPVATGVYYYRLTAGNYRAAGKTLRVR